MSQHFPRTLVFASPSKYWSDIIRKTAGHTPVYMSPWTFEEMIDAVARLNLSISVETLEKRYYYFGGVARHCMLLDNLVVENELLAVN